MTLNKKSCYLYFLLFVFQLSCSSCVFICVCRHACVCSWLGSALWTEMGFVFSCASGQSKVPVFFFLSRIVIKKCFHTQWFNLCTMQSIVMSVILNWKTRTFKRRSLNRSKYILKDGFYMFKGAFKSHTHQVLVFFIICHISLIDEGVGYFPHFIMILPFKHIFA